MKQINQYIIALTNLYGQVSPSIVAEIYNSQNEQKTDSLEVEAQLKEDFSLHYIYSYEDHFVHESLMGFDDFERIERLREGKPTYVPEKEELLKYSDMDYFEEPEQYQKLLDYVETEFIPHHSKEKAEMLCEDFLFTCRFDFETQKAVDFIHAIGTDFSSNKQLKEVADLVIDLANNVRLWEDYGHTSQEIQNISDNRRRK